MAEPVTPPDRVEPLSAACLRHGCERARFDRRVVLHTVDCDLAHITAVAAHAGRLVAIPVAHVFGAGTPPNRHPGGVP